jgi:hypothetical protein
MLAKGDLSFGHYVVGEAAFEAKILIHVILWFNHLFVKT